MTLHSFSLLLYAFVAACLHVSAAELAWNSHTTPGSTTPTAFLPFYVPPGAKSYDSASPLLLYSGKWTELFSTTYVGKSLRQSSEVGAAILFVFTGSGIEWFGNCDRNHGVSDVYIDGLLAQSVDAWCDVDTPRKQQRIFWNYALEPASKHILKIINTGACRGTKRACLSSMDALVVTKGLVTKQPNSTPSSLSSLAPYSSRPPSLLLSASQPAEKWTLVQKGSTGVHAMQLAVISSTHALVVDKVEHNPLTIDGHPAWAALYNIDTHAVQPLAMKSNSFCAGGTFLGNGTMIVVGGNPVVDGGQTSSADFGDLNGLQSMRLFEPCPSSSVDNCTMYENPDRIRMASPRWYNTVVRISDGSAMIIGGSKKGGWMNNATVNNPTLEYFPPKSLHGSNGLPIDMPFLRRTLNSNLFPIAFALPDGTIFMAANNDTIIYDWEANTERQLPSIPNGVRVTYPMAGTALLLPLSPDNNYEPQILICGGSNVDDTKPGYEISSQDPASKQCARLVLTDDGIAAGWEVDEMPEARLMPDAVLLPTGEVVLVNGAASGISGYGNVVNQVGASNADHAVLTPVLYTPSAPLGGRFSSDGIPSSEIPRMYHSVATLTPRGDIMIAGSNPNLDRSEIMYGTEYRVEWLGPPYMAKARPQILDGPRRLGFGQQAVFKVRLPPGLVDVSDVKVALMDFGYVTHAVHANSRLVYLVATLSTNGATLSIAGPPNGKIYPPGPGWLFLVVNGIPSKAVHLMVGDGKGPKVDEGAIENVIKNTKPPQYEQSKSGGGEA
ncbi:copper radical oxidase [Mycena belliarum]|uniref:Copper radical oxidase n=1 Tax=Mycena belliarum TaxID=1033014 RepID=A0AAD6XKZ6_9AGAR|nr:copper radical oxidase [Mycena belliae]